jgi:hypothetical protein
MRQYVGPPGVAVTPRSPISTLAICAQPEPDGSKTFNTPVKPTVKDRVAFMFNQAKTVAVSPESEKTRMSQINKMGKTKLFIDG